MPLQNGLFLIGFYAYEILSYESKIYLIRKTEENLLTPPFPHAILPLRKKKNHKKKTRFGKFVSLIELIFIRDRRTSLFRNLILFADFVHFVATN